MKNILVLSSIFLVFFGCKRSFDSPPKRELPIGNILSIDSLRKIFKSKPVSFNQDYSVYATVTADEVDGNLYKNVYVQDNTGAINLRLTSSGGLYRGDYIRINLNGTVLSSYNGMLQLDSVDVNKNVVKQNVLQEVSPIVVTDISKLDKTFESKLIKLQDVQVQTGDVGKTWANATAQQSLNINISDCKGNKPIIVRTSGYANYAGTQVPSGNGSLVAVVGTFNGTLQLYLRSLGEVQMNAARCTTSTNPVGVVLTIDDVRKMYKGTNVTFDKDYSVYAIVTTDESDGNIYKNVYVQDSTGAINLRLASTGGLNRGDNVLISLKGTVLSSFNGMLQIDPIDVSKNIVKQTTTKLINPIGISDISLLDNTYESKLIKLENVQVLASDIGKTWADVVGKKSTNITVTDCKGNPIIIRTSGYANYAGNKVPDGNGSLVAVLGIFNGTLQLYLRSLGEVQMTSSRCTTGGGGTPKTYITKDFDKDANLTDGNWLIKNISGNYKWEFTGFNGNNYALANSFKKGDANNETWYISPSIDLSSSINPILYFSNASNFSGPDLEVYAFKNYDGNSDLANADKTKLSGWSLSPGNYKWTNSGDIDLANFKVNDVRIGFKYTGTTNSGKAWQLDGITVKDK